MAEITDGNLVQSAINAVYLWRDHVIQIDHVEAFLAKYDLFVEDEKIGMRDIFNQDGSQFWIARAIESPYGLEIHSLAP